MNAKDFADFARRTAQPNMKSWGGNLNLWLPVPATVAEWEAKSIRFHAEQAQRQAQQPFFFADSGRPMELARA